MWLPNYPQGNEGWRDPQLYGGGVGQLAAHMAALRQQQQQQAIAAGKQLGNTLAQQMQKRKQDQIAQAMLGTEFKDDPEVQQALQSGVSSSDAYQLGLDNAQGHAADLDTYYKNQLRQTQINKLNAPDTTPTAPIVDPATGLIWNGRQWVHPPGQSARGNIKIPGKIISGSAEGTDPGYQGPVGVQAGQNYSDSILSTERGTAPQDTSGFIVGKQYRDKNGNVATYQGNGQWQ